MSISVRKLIILAAANVLEEIGSPELANVLRRFRVPVLDGYGDLYTVDPRAPTTLSSRSHYFVSDAMKGKFLFLDVTRHTVFAPPDVEVLVPGACLEQEV